jgi:hypothetical protein
VDHCANHREPAKPNVKHAHNAMISINAPDSPGNKIERFSMDLHVIADPAVSEWEK